MIRAFATPKEKEINTITITAQAEVVTILEDNILEPGILN